MYGEIKLLKIMAPQPQNNSKWLPDKKCSKWFRRCLRTKTSKKSRKQLGVNNNSKWWLFICANSNRKSWKFSKNMNKSTSFRKNRYKLMANKWKCKATRTGHKCKCVVNDFPLLFTHRECTTGQSWVVYHLIFHNY